MGMHGTDCTHGSGTAKISLFDNHVIGCTTVCPTGLVGCTTGTTPQKCSSDQVGFLDANRTIYGYDQTAGHTATPSHPIMGTVSTVQIAAGSSCAVARAAVRPDVQLRTHAKETPVGLAGRPAGVG